MTKVGDVLGGRYVLRESIGHGGMGTVYLADELALARRVAVKVMHPWLATQLPMVMKFRGEAVAARKVCHPGVAVVLDCDDIAGVPYIVMEYVPGRPLGCVIADEPISVARAIRIALGMLAILDAAHRSGVVHADIKSDNFILDADDRVTLIDFGLARCDGDADPALSVAISGTPEYMAPEVIRGERPTRAADLYAVGAILYELLTGATPFGGGSASDIMQRHLEDDAVPPSLRDPDRFIPPLLDEIVLRALAKIPSDRFADAEELAAALRSVRVGDDVAVARTAASRESPTLSYLTPSVS